MLTNLNKKIKKLLNVKTKKDKLEEKIIDLSKRLETLKKNKDEESQIKAKIIKKYIKNLNKKMDK
jgi:hypothetical protein